jgi:hypothetical protein
MFPSGKYHSPVLLVLQHGILSVMHWSPTSGLVSSVSLDPPISVIWMTLSFASTSSLRDRYTPIYIIVACKHVDHIYKHPTARNSALKVPISIILVL